MKLFQHASEPDDIYVALVSELYAGWVPTLIMGMTFFGISSFTAHALGNAFLFIPASVGAVLTAAKLGLVIKFRHRGQLSSNDRASFVGWERGYGLTSIGFAAMLAFVAATSFRSSHLSLQMLATGMLFGYCSGVVACSSVRPRIARIVTATAAVPVIISAAMYGNAEHWILATVFATFLGGSFLSVRQVYTSASRQIAMRLDMATLARNDPLTGLVNRLGLREAFRTMSASGRHLPMVAVHCFDLDRFKPVNDRYGHPAGDALLRTLAERIRATICAGDVAARIGGDEFVIIQKIERADEAEIFARRLVRAITAAYDIGGDAINIGVSLGYATSPPEARNLDDLIATADAALYRMKRSGGGVALGDPRSVAA